MCVRTCLLPQIVDQAKDFWMVTAIIYSLLMTCAKPRALAASKSKHTWKNFFWKLSRACDTDDWTKNLKLTKYNARLYINEDGSCVNVYGQSQGCCCRIGQRSQWITLPAARAARYVRIAIWNSPRTINPCISSSPCSKKITRNILWWDLATHSKAGREDTRPIIYRVDTIRTAPLSSFFGMIASSYIRWGLDFAGALVTNGGSHFVRRQFKKAIGLSEAAHNSEDDRDARDHCGYKVWSEKQASCNWAVQLGTFQSVTKQISGTSHASSFWDCWNDDCCLVFLKVWHRALGRGRIHLCKTNDLQISLPRCQNP